MAAVAALGGGLGAFTAALAMISWVAAPYAPNNPIASAYAMLYGAGGLCVALGIAIVVRVCPAVARGEFGWATVAANLFVLTVLWAVCALGWIALGAG